MRNSERMPKNKICRLTYFLLAVCFSLALGFFSAWAVGTEGNWESQSQALSSVPGLVVRVVFWLMLIAILIWALVYLLKRLSIQRSGKAPQGSNIQVLDKTLIAPKKAIYVVKIAGKITALGVTDSQINMLTELPAEDTLAIYAEKSSTLPFIQDLKRKLSHWGNREKNARTPTEG